MTNPGQAFEAALAARLAVLVPGRVLEPLAVDEAQGWLLLPSGGPTLRDAGQDSAQSWRRVLR